MHTYLEAVFPHVEDSESVVGAEYGAEMFRWLAPSHSSVRFSLNFMAATGGGGGGGGGGG